MDKSWNDIVLIIGFGGAVGYLCGTVADIRKVSDRTLLEVQDLKRKLLDRDDQ